MDFFEQHQQWLKLRCGKFTASEMHKLLKGGSRPMTEEELVNREKGNKRTTVDTTFGDVAMGYINEKISEILSGEVKELGNIKALEWGAQWESSAFDAFQAWQKANLNHIFNVEYFGMSNPKYIPFNIVSGGSPDGSGDCTLEIKCPFNGANHIDVLKEFHLSNIYEDSNEWIRENRPEYYTQIQFNMLCAKLSGAYFVSYDPRCVKDDLKLAVLLVSEDKEHQELIVDRINKATDVVAETLQLLQV